MSLNLIKLCVGIDTVEQLQEAQAVRLENALASGVEKPVLRHVTRNTPRRGDEILSGGGSLYWVIRRVIRVRQRIVGFEEVEREDGKPACAILLHPELVRTVPRSFRPFQGWRYFTADSAPADLEAGEGQSAQLPDDMADELRTLGLI